MYRIEKCVRIYEIRICRNISWKSFTRQQLQKRLRFWRYENGRNISGSDTYFCTLMVGEWRFRYWGKDVLSGKKLFYFFWWRYFSGITLLSRFGIGGFIQYFHLLFSETFSLATTFRFISVHTKVLGNIRFENRILYVWNLEPEDIKYQYAKKRYGDNPGLHQSQICINCY